MVKKNSNQSFFVRKKKILIISFVILVLLTICSVGAYSKIKENRAKRVEARKNSQSLVNKSNLAHQIESDIVFGDANAPVTMIEYASLSCPHCAAFYNNIFDKIKEHYIDTKKVKFIYRDFPLDKSALFAALISSCSAKNNQNDSTKYYQLIKVLFKNQDDWAFGSDFFEKLRSLAKLRGMTEKEFTDCANNQDLINQILQNRLRAAQELGIDSTPTFIIGGQVIGGQRDFNAFKKIIDEKLKQVK